MTQTKILNFLTELPLFAATASTLLQKVITSDNAHLVTLAPGESPTPQFEEMLGIVLFGKLQILSADKQNPVVLRAVGTGHVFGAASLFLEAHSPVSRLVAQSECKLLYLSREAVRTLLRADEHFMDAYLHFLAERVHFLNAKIRAFTAGSAERRLALWLTEHAPDGTVRASSLSVLADTLDIARASLYRALDKLEQEGDILRNGREICVPSPETLLQKYRS